MKTISFVIMYAMRLFKRTMRPEELGEVIYEELRRRLESDAELSLDRFLESLDLDPSSPEDQHAGHIMVGLVFGASMAAERSATARIAQKIISGMKTEFVNHLEEQGANAVQRAEWEATMAALFLQYRTCLEEYTGFEPPWKLGRQFYWNLIGRERYVALSIKIATLYLLTARDIAQDLLNEYGPLILPEKREN